MGGEETQLLGQWGRRRESAWKLKAAKGPGGGKVRLRPALATKPASAWFQVSRWRRAWRTDAAVEKCRMRRAQSAGPGSRKRCHTPSGTLGRFEAQAQSPRVIPGWKFSFRLLLGPQNLSPLLPCSDKERRTALLGESGGGSRHRWVAIKTLIAAFWGADQVSFPTCRFPASKNPPPAALLRGRARFKGKSKEARNCPTLESFAAPS